MHIESYRYVGYLFSFQFKSSYLCQHITFVIMYPLHVGCCLPSNKFPHKCVSKSNQKFLSTDEKRSKTCISFYNLGLNGQKHTNTKLSSCLRTSSWRPRRCTCGPARGSSDRGSTDPCGSCSNVSVNRAPPPKTTVTLSSSAVSPLQIRDRLM